MGRGMGHHGPVSGYPRRAGNLVTPWIDGVPFYERLLAAMRGARVRVWAIVSFIAPDFRFNDGTLWWDLLDECVARGVEVRVLFWRNPGFFKTDHVFLGGAKDREFLQRRGAAWAGRWDSSGADRGHCHHQKGYVIDAEEEEGAVAFVGGMVLSTSTLARPGHAEGLAKHDAFVELQGPVVVDAARNFVQRWNLARMDEEAPPWPDALRAGALAWPEVVPPVCGESEVQLTRTVQAGCYECVEGEASIFDHYKTAIARARRTIYIENQHPGELTLLKLVGEALARGVQVVMVVPAEPMRAICVAAAEVVALGDGFVGHRYGPTFRALAELAAYPGFTLAALARSDPDGGRREIYVHAKLCIVDGAWATIGSANLVDLSLLKDHTELNASIWDPRVCLKLLCELVNEHTGEVVADDVEALAVMARSARASRDSLMNGGPVLAGCHALDAARYGVEVIAQGRGG